MRCNERGSYFCALLVAGALLAGTWAAYASEAKTLEGTVSNTHCGLKHQNPSADAKGCVNSCVQNMGAKYALVVGDQIYELDGGAAELEKLAGQKAKVTGTVDGMKIQVSAVSAASGSA